MAAVGGNGLFPRGVFAVDSVLQRKRLIFADTDEIFYPVHGYSHWKIDGRLVRRLLDKSGDTISWLMDKGVDFCDGGAPYQPGPGGVPYYQRRGKCGQRGDPVSEKVLLGAWRHTADPYRGKQLTQDDHGAVTGAICERTARRSISLRARSLSAPAAFPVIRK